MKQTYSHYSQNNIYLHKSVGVEESRRTGYPAESHSRIELLLLISGKLDYIIDGATFPVSPGDLIVVGARELHSLKIDPSEPYERIVVQFSPKHIPRLQDADLQSVFSNAYRYQHIIPKELVKRAKIDKVMYKLISCIALKYPYRDLAILSELMRLIAEIHRTSNQLLTTKAHLMLPPPQKQTALLNSAIEYVNANLTKPITAESAAFALGISKDYLYHFFKEQMGVPFRQYVQNQKMQLAYMLIQQGYSVQRTAEYLGYEYYATFFTQYKRVFKKPPSVHSQHPTMW